MSAITIILFWIVGKLFLKALKFVLIAAIGAAVAATFVLGPMFLLYGLGVAIYGAYAFFADKPQVAAAPDECGSEGDEQ